MMQELIEYQKLDEQKRKLEQDIAENADRKNAKDMQNKLKEFQSKVFELEEKAQEIVSAYENQLKEIDKIEKEISKQTTSNAKISEDVVADKTALVSIKDSLNKLERELVAIQQAQEKIIKDNNFVMKNAVIANKNLGVYKERYNSAKQSKEPEIAEIIKKMNALSGKIDKGLFAKYKQISEAKPLPVFVPISAGRCSRCRMEIPMLSQNNLKQKGYIECENCGRIIYWVD